MITELPEHFECAGFTWSVHFVRGLRKKEKADGLTDWRKKEVHIHAGMPEDETLHTFLHEVLHIALHAMGLDKYNKNRYDDTVDGLAGMLHQIFKSSRGILEYEEREL